MLKGIDPLLNADVLYALRAMGHGDALIIAFDRLAACHALGREFQPRFGVGVQPTASRTTMATQTNRWFFI